MLRFSPSSTCQWIIIHVLGLFFKPEYAYLRSQGHVSIGYLEDSFLEEDTYQSCKNTYQSCENNVTTTANLLDSLGFSPHQEKSVTTPSQIIEHLGFLSNSIDMT
ncbi:Hypothetical predicted protein, partial [Paramuricea clavata]